MLDRKKLEQWLREIESEKIHLEGAIEGLKDRPAKVQAAEEVMTALINCFPDTPSRPQRQPKAKAPRQSQTDIIESISDRILQELKNAGFPGMTVKQIKQSLPGISEAKFQLALRYLKDRVRIRDHNGFFYVPEARPEGVPVKAAERHLST